MSHRSVRGRVRCTTAAILLCAIASLVAVSPAQAAPAGTSSPPSPTSTDPAIVARQAPLLAVTDRIIDLTRSGDASGYGGFADIAIAPTNDYIQLYWHGPLPESIRQILDRSAPTARVEVIPAAQTARELNALASRLASQRAKLAAEGLPLVRIRHLPGAAGLEIGIDAAAAPAVRYR